MCDESGIHKEVEREVKRDLLVNAFENETIDREIRLKCPDYYFETIMTLPCPCMF